MKRLDLSTSVPIADRFQADEQVPFPMARHSTIFRLCRAAENHHVLAHVRPCLGLCPGPGNAQRTAGAQAAHQLALKRAASLNVEGLVNGFMRDTHGLIIGEVDLQPIGNLFGWPAINPFAITAMRFIPPLERCLSRPGNLSAISVMHLALQALLYVAVKPHISC